ncbi:hypothetical protein GGR51DRAFT_161040 [Nemania sp. FL0031]|nr:hypothetical protein GGR51DRAFT_161040 [Nemania sp. FL0031]
MEVGLCGKTPPWAKPRGLETAFSIFDELDCDNLIDFIYPGKNYAWNLQSAKEGKFGSVEFRGALSVVTAKKAKHRIAFTMAFASMSIKFEPKKFVRDWVNARGSYRAVHRPDF